MSNDVNTCHVELARIWSKQCCDGAYEGGFASAVWAEQRGESTRFGSEVQPSEGVHFAKGFRETSGLDNGCHEDEGFRSW